MRRLTAGSSKSPNNVISTFFIAVHLLPKDLRFEHGGAKLASCPGRHLISLHPCIFFMQSHLFILVRYIDHITEKLAAITTDLSSFTTSLTSKKCSTSSLQEMLKSCDKALEGYHLLERALATMTQIAHHINNMKRKHEDTVRLQVLFGKTWRKLKRKITLINSCLNLPCVRMSP